MAIECLAHIPLFPGKVGGSILEVAGFLAGRQLLMRTLFVSYRSRGEEHGWLNALIESQTGYCVKFLKMANSNSNILYLNTIGFKAQSLWGRVQIKLIKCRFLRRGENQSTRGKTSQSREENQQTQPTY